MCLAMIGPEEIVMKYSKPLFIMTIVITYIYVD